MKWYVVEMSPAQALRLSSDQLALATAVDNGLTKRLVFRDRFIAVKIASLSGGTFRQGELVEVVPGLEAAQGFEVGGRTLLFDAEPATIEA